MLGSEAQGAVEPGRRVLPRDHLGELDDLIVVEVLTNPREQRRRHIGGRHRVGVGERCARRGVEQPDPLVDGRVGVEGAASDRDDRTQLFVGDSLLAANCSVDVLSEHAADERGDAPIEDRVEGGRQQPGLVEPAPHRPRPR